MTDRELMQQALEALVQIHPGNMTPMAEEAWNKAIALLGERLSQPDQEPRQWQGLTDEQIKAPIQKAMKNFGYDPDQYSLGHSATLHLQ